MSPLSSYSISSAISPRDSQRKRAQFLSPEFPRRVDRSDPDRSREISAVRYRHEARQPRVIAIAIAVPDCDSFYREPIDRIANIDRTIVRRACFPPSSDRFPGYPRVGRPRGQGKIGTRTNRIGVECLPSLVIVHHRPMDFNLIARITRNNNIFRLFRI